MRLREEHGFTLPELLIAMVMFVIILGATLSIFDASGHLSSANARQSDSIEESRVAIDQVTRQLRNLASPTTPQSTIDTATAYNLVFQTDDPSKTWVRYCLLTNAGAQTGTLYYATSPGSTLTDLQKGGTCPGSGWPTPPRVVAQDVTNQAGGQDRPVFSYQCTSGALAGCPASSSDNNFIVFANVRLDIDVNPGHAPAEKQVSSGVYLRNQNEAPAASFPMPTNVPPAGSRTIILNASASSDPEGRTLHYYWCKGSTAPCSSTSSFFIGTGVTLTYTFPPSDTGAQTITLTVQDPGGLTSTVSKGPPSTPITIP